MKNKLLIFVCCFSSLFAEAPVIGTTPTVRDQFRYVSIGAGAILPGMPEGSLTIGYRSQWGHHGFDASLQGTTFAFWFSQVEFDLLYHYYFKPNLASQFYLGAGICPGVNIEASSRWNHSGDSCFSLCPEVAAGYEYRTGSGGVRFVDAQITFPITRCLYGQQPLIIMSYGFGL